MVSAWHSVGSPPHAQPMLADCPGWRVSKPPNVGLSCVVLSA
jgi:hypothetical protein